MRYLITAIILFTSSIVYSQNEEYTASDKYQFGQPNPKAPEQIKDFQPMIGICECKSVQRNKDGTWQDTLNMVWKFKYILNGMAIQDETWHESGFSATSIRQFNTDSLYWVVSYYGTKFISNNVSVWTGNKKNDQIVLKMPQRSPSGIDGFSRLTFYDISNAGFNWKGEWIDKNETITYPFWIIYCIKRK